jgi:hypothetical protein
MKQPQVGVIERGEKKLSVLSFNKISKALQIQPNDLMIAPNIKSAPAWERKIVFLINSQPESIKELMFKTLNSLAKRIQLSK